MKANEALIAWPPGSKDEIGVGPLLAVGARDWTHPYRYTGGAAFTQTRDKAGVESVAQVFVDFHTIVVRDGLDPVAVHREFPKIEEYADNVSPELKPSE